MPDTRRWKPVDDWFAEAGESWATITATQPGGPYRAPRTRPDTEDQKPQSDPTTAATSTRTTKAAAHKENRKPR
ncbi:hypothetical protein [Streptomyces maremycinicus]|uniref:hypothetical protein n=1 Tax=Streptomyces maremycinicus TaxID=1679753 RepID=UPI000789037C|nr:hypothetical protein [Streptomyces sp. NBRC 110468]